MPFANPGFASGRVKTSPVASAFRCSDLTPSKPHQCGADQSVVGYRFQLRQVISRCLIAGRGKWGSSILLQRLGAGLGTFSAFYPAARPLPAFGTTRRHARLIRSLRWPSIQVGLM